MKHYIWHKLTHRFTFGEDQAPEEETIENIEKGIQFQGAKLWVLILAIFVASLGLNTNSTAVIIGAMLISPLMGPILGMGLSAGIHDFRMLHKAFKNYFVATIFSVITATLYFLLTPFGEAQSELLARTSPTIYDVLIALCGGLAGIIALSSKSQRTGNVIPGVAIATALMPPLCTVGFGLATANWMYALGALYLYVINTVFISLATYIGVEFIFRFRNRTDLDPSRERKFRYALAVLGIFVLLPSSFVTLGIVRQSIFQRNVHQFCAQATELPGTHLIGHEADYDSQSIKLIFMGQEVDSSTIASMQQDLPKYHLDGVSLHVIQGATGISDRDMKVILGNQQERAKASTRMLAADEEKIAELERQITPYDQLSQLTDEIRPELQVLFPQVTHIALAQGRTMSLDTLATDTTLTYAIYQVGRKMSPADVTRMREWLQTRLQRSTVITVQQ